MDILVEITTCRIFHDNANESLGLKDVVKLHNVRVAEEAFEAFDLSLDGPVVLDLEVRLFDDFHCIDFICFPVRSQANLGIGTLSQGGMGDHVVAQFVYKGFSYVEAR